MKKSLFLLMAVAALLPRFSLAGQCSITVDHDGQKILNAGNRQYLEIEVSPSGENLRLLTQICNETYAATHCREYQLEKDEWQRQEGDPKSFSVNMGRERAELTIGSLPSWIAQFATKNYNKDQKGTYYSLEACEHNRSRIAIEVAERAHEVLEDQEDAAARKRRQEQIMENPYWGPKF
jgi:hypothetical protein